MSKTLKTVATIAGAAALIATGVGAFAVAGSALAATAASVSTFAGLAATAASIGSQLTQKKPKAYAQGSLTQVLIQTDPPQPYLMGRTYFGGVLRHDVGYGGTVGDVKNPYRGSVVVYSGCGPVQALVAPQIDFQAISSWYSGYAYTASQLGATPEAAALTPNWSGMTGWGASSKLSGQAAILWNFKFDKEGKKFSSGLPPFGAIWQGVKVYDPRLDSTYPGGSGTHRIDDETTWAYSTNPALHAIAYAYGRRQNGKKVFGVGLPASAIDLARFVSLANVCDSNSWEVGGVIFEPGDRWANLKDILIAGGAEPVFSGGVLSCRYRAPQVALETVTQDDLADDDAMVTAMQTYRDRINGIVPKYRSEAHNWEYVSSDLVSVSSYVTEDGEVKDEERQFNLVQDKDHAAQLAAYDLVDARELGPVEITLKPEWRAYKPGECLYLDLPDLGLATNAIILSRDIDPGTMKVKFVLVGETGSKHAYALGLTGTAPPTPALGDVQDRDETFELNQQPLGYLTQIIGSSYTTDADPADGLIQAAESGGTTTITVETHTRTYSDKTSAVSITGASLTTEDDGTTAITTETTYHIYYDDSTRAGGGVSFKATKNGQTAATKGSTPGRHYVGSILTPAVGGTSQSPGASPPGWDPSDYCVADDTPILLASGMEVPAAWINVGASLLTQHEHTMEWGAHKVEAISFIEADVYACRVDGRDGPVCIRATADHRFWLGGEWVRAQAIGKPCGRARVAKITVADAHTYVSAGVLSHNAKA